MDKDTKGTWINNLTAQGFKPSKKLLAAKAGASAAYKTAEELSDREVRAFIASKGALPPGKAVVATGSRYNFSVCIGDPREVKAKGASRHSLDMLFKG